MADLNVNKSESSAITESLGVVEGLAFDHHKNFAYSTIAVAPSPASSGTSLTVASGDGVNFGTGAFNATVWPAGARPTASNAEIVRVTAGPPNSDTFTITRTQEGSSARTIVVGDQIAQTITAKTLTDAEALSSQAIIASVVTDQGTTSTSYTDLATVGPAVTVNVGSSGLLLIVVSCQTNNNATGEDFMSYALSGANTLSAADSNSYQAATWTSGAHNTGSRVTLQTGLTPGATTVTAKYRTTSSTGNFNNRQVTAIPL